MFVYAQFLDADLWQKTLVSAILHNRKGCVPPGGLSLVQLETSEPIACPSFPVMLPWKQGEK